MKQFIVFDKTGKEVTIEDVYRIEPDWIKSLTYRGHNDLEFALGQDGTLYIIDGCGNYVSVTEDWEVIYAWRGVEHTME